MQRGEDTDTQYGEHTEAAKRAQRQQQEAVAAAEHRRKLRTMVVPTDDAEVRVWLRKLREPITLFGERAMERRERLRGLMTNLDDEQRNVLMDRLMQLEVATQHAPAELFYTEGPEELRELRRRFAVDAAERAHVRLEAQRNGAEDSREEAKMVLADAASMANVSSQIGGKRPLQGVAVSADGDVLVTADWNGAVAMWTLEDRMQQLTTWQAHEDRCTDVKWHPAAVRTLDDGSTRSPELLTCATASADATVKLWSMKGTCLHTCRGHTRRLARMAFHPTGHALATCSFDGTWRLWEVERATCLMEQEGHSREVYSVGFHPDGALLGSGGLDAITRIWDARTGRNVLTFRGHTYGVLSLAFSPNGVHVATGSLDNSIRVWDLRARGALYCIAGHTKLVSHVQFEPRQGHYLLSTSYDQTCRLWRAFDWQPCTTLAGHMGIVMSADICRDTGAIVSVGYDKGIKLWKPNVSDEDMQPMEE